MKQSTPTSYTPNPKITRLAAFTLGWMNCPHCKKLIMYGDYKDIEKAKKWKKQK